MASPGSTARQGGEMSGWPWIYTGFEAEQEGVRETLTTLGNGYFCTRGAAPWADADDDVHYPGTYVHGGYNRLVTEIGGHPVENEDLVNLPNWLPLTFRIEDADFFDLDAVEVLTYRHELRIRAGELHHDVHVRDDAGRETVVTWRRLVSLDQPHLAALQMTLCPVNWSGRITVRSALDGRVVNWGVKRYRELEHRHLIPLETGAHGDLLHLVVQTNHSQIAIAQAARTRVFSSDEWRDVERRKVEEDGYVADHLTFEVEQGHATAVEKIVALYVSKDRASTEPGLHAREAVGIAPDFEALALAHQDAWERLWRRCDLVYTADENVQQILRLHTFHALQVTSPHTVDLDTSAPARGLHGEAYRGHIFWDELYIFPYFLHRAPEIVRGLLLYRYRRLDAARALARAEGYRGAMFPWQSGSSGREETQTMHLNPKSGRWNPDTSHHQRHVSLAVAFNTWEYVRVTDDRDFLATHGAELLVEIARFWASISHFDETRGRYEIHGVMGPDEYHESYPDSDQPGLRNNAYTNVMVAWLMDAVAEALKRLDANRRADLLERLGVANEELALWSEMSGKLFVPFHGEGIISQFEGYEALKELDWDAYREKYGNIQRMDRILEAEGDSANNYQLSKQADVLMLFYLFSPGALQHLFGKLGYPCDSGTIRRNVEYYEARTSHGSTLSNLVHAAVTASYAPEEAWRKYLAALESDVADIQGGTTKEGIHLGVMAGTLDLLQRGILGLDVAGDTLTLDPVLPGHLAGLAFSLHFRGRPLDVAFSEGQLTLGLHRGALIPLEVRVGADTATLGPGDTRTFSLS
jgi:trehalose/maltose hydrolase-like predicted phosphorylase